MQQYVIIGRDGTDAEALTRRLAVRPQHLEGAALLRSKGQFVEGGAILNADGQMIGSVMILQFETQAEFDAWYAQEPYVTAGVWQQIEVHPFMVAPR